MKINFKNRKLRELCEQRAAAERKLGTPSARKLRTRLAELEAAGNVTDLVVGSPHPLKGDRSGQFALDLHGGQRLVFAPDHDPQPLRPDGAIDWSAVTIICIEFIGDYHD